MIPISYVVLQGHKKYRFPTWFARWRFEQSHNCCKVAGRLINTTDTQTRQIVGGSLKLRNIILTCYNPFKQHCTVWKTRAVKDIQIRKCISKDTGVQTDTGRGSKTHMAGVKHIHIIQWSFKDTENNCWTFDYTAEVDVKTKCKTNLAEVVVTDTSRLRVGWIVLLLVDVAHNAL